MTKGRVIVVSQGGVRSGPLLRVRVCVSECACPSVRVPVFRMCMFVLRKCERMYAGGVSSKGRTLVHDVGDLVLEVLRRLDQVVHARVSHGDFPADTADLWVRLQRVIELVNRSGKWGRADIQQL